MKKNIFIDGETGTTGLQVHEKLTKHPNVNILSVNQDKRKDLDYKKEMFEAAKSGFSTATDLADYLVIKGLPFRDAHDVVGKAVAFGISENRDLSEMTLDELTSFSSNISEDVFDILTLEGSVKSRDHVGGTSPDQVKSAAERALLKIQNR